ncbi:C-type lectin lectoxin-Thr1-like [Pantherophis guttatus]|uniref:C-type lectin lectoxin-Thr1-like n=1 Tax=Pantherophis guttatus TaxID=94885 RepID=A0ABM3ZA94_PANGU|nr:C-type lectin lectoxin-Thr1-like [Pantherophis guttatus]
MGFASFCVPFLGFLVASFFIQGLEAVSCPLNWFLYEQHCYGFFENKLTWNNAETRFRWLDAAVVEYVPWAPSEPSTYKGDCVQIHGSDYKYWSLQFCEKKQPYLCKMAVY